MELTLFSPPYHRSHLIVDSTLCPIERPGENQQVFYSIKHKTHGLKYELGVRKDGLICWVYGPVPGSVHDITIIRQGGLKDYLYPNEFIIGDKGYVGENWILVPFKGSDLSLEQRGWNHGMHSARAQVEITIGWIKNFKAMAMDWREEWDKNAMCFRVCCFIVNMSIQTR